MNENMEEVKRTRKKWIQLYCLQCPASGAFFLTRSEPPAVLRLPSYSQSSPIPILTQPRHRALGALGAGTPACDAFDLGHLNRV